MAKILCAVDLSGGSTHVLDVAAAFARALGASLDVVHVVEPPGSLAGDLASALVASLREGAEAKLAQSLRARERGGLGVSGWVEVGRADEVVLAAAETTKPALLVVGTHGRGPLVRALVGSVAERVMRRAACPVLVVPPRTGAALDEAWCGGQRPLRLVVGVDPRGLVGPIVAWLRDLRVLVACELTIVHAYCPPQESRRLGLPIEAARDGSGEIPRILEREVRTCLHGLGDIAGDVEVKVRPAWDGPVKILREEAAAIAADLLVLGTSVGGGASTAIAALRDTGVPILCVPGIALAEHAVAARADGRVRSALVFTDLSSQGEQAINEAAWLLRGRGGVLTICHVVAPGAPHAQEAARASLLARANAAARDYDLEATTLLHESLSLPEGVVQAIRRVGPDIVVIGSRHGSGGATALGPITDLVMRHVAVPVVVVPAPAAGKTSPKAQTAGQAA